MKKKTFVELGIQEITDLYGMLEDSELTRLVKDITSDEEYRTFRKFVECLYGAKKIKIISEAEK